MLSWIRIRIFNPDLAPLTHLNPESGFETRHWVSRCLLSHPYIILCNLSVSLCCGFGLAGILKAQYRIRSKWDHWVWIRCLIFHDEGHKWFGSTLPFFFIYFYINRADIQYLYKLLVEYRYHSCSHCFRSVQGLVWGAEPRFEFGPALQQADALLSEPRRTLKPRNDSLCSWWWIVRRLLAAAWPWWCCTPASSVSSYCGPPLAFS